MANEFWNVLITAIASFIVGMVIHSALGHTYGDRLREIFHKKEKPQCYGNCFYRVESCIRLCSYNKKCEEICLTSTE